MSWEFHGCEESILLSHMKGALWNNNATIICCGLGLKAAIKVQYSHIPVRNVYEGIIVVQWEMLKALINLVARCC